MKNEISQKLFDELGIEKASLLGKHNLTFKQPNEWWCTKENTHHHLVVRHSYVIKHDLIDVLFRINKLCFAKLNYFKSNIYSYEYLKFDTELGFITVPLWDAEFFRHTETKKIVDFRKLQSITVYDDFISYINTVAYENTIKTL